MNDDKKIEQKPKPEIEIERKPIKPGEIIGKIDVHDNDYRLSK